MYQEITKDEDMYGYVYIIKVKEYYKIGRTTNPKKRFTDFSIFMEKLEVVHCQFTKFYKHIEKELHKMFSHKNTNGEWFLLTEDELNVALNYLNYYKEEDNNAYKDIKVNKVTEDLKMSKAIIELHLLDPSLSQNDIVRILNSSKGKVNKTLQRYRDGYYDEIFDFNKNEDC